MRLHVFALPAFLFEIAGTLKEGSIIGRHGHHQIHQMLVAIGSFRTATPETTISALLSSTFHPLHVISMMSSFLIIRALNYP